MGTGRREFQREKKKLNIVKVIIVAILVIAVVIGIYFLFKDNNSKTDEEYDKQIEEALVEEVEEEKTRTIDDIVAEFGGQIGEQVKPDTYYITKDGKDYTAYLDGEIVEGKIIPWNGESAQPAIDEAGNINIYSAAELKWVADQVINGDKNFAGVTITLRNNIDLGARKNGDNWEGTPWTPIVGFLDELPPKENSNANTQATLQEEVPVPDDSVNVKQENLKRFAGVFNGNSLSIRGMYINSDKRYQGLFGYQVGEIQNLNIKNSNVKGDSGVAAIVGLNGGTVSNCNIQNVDVKGTEKIGGIVGINMTSSKVTNCNVLDDNCFIYADKYAGGIVGYMNNNSVVDNCKNKANVTGKDYIGGITGIAFFGTTISNCGNLAMNVVGENYVGGIAGYSQAQIEKTFNHNSENPKGIVSGTEFVGGLVGLNYLMGNITDSYNNGEVKATIDNLGGIAGLNNSTISNCYNLGKINAKETEGGRVGGVCGQNISESYIYSSYNIGKIEYKTSAEGVVGANFGTVSNCFYLDSSLENPNADKSNSKNENDMKTVILSELGDGYKSDDGNINSGYPILIWQ